MRLPFAPPSGASSKPWGTRCWWPIRRPRRCLLLRRSEPPDLLLTDVVLGAGMNGIDLTAAARAALPNLPVIFMSGFTAVPEAQERIKALAALEAINTVATGPRGERRVPG